MAEIVKFPLFCPSDSWWIVQVILGQPNLNMAAVGVYTALVKDSSKRQGLYWLDPIVDQVGGVDWIALPADETPMEDPTRKAARARLGALKRLPLSKEGAEERQSILAASKATQGNCTTAVRTIADLLATQEGRARCLALLEAVRAWQDTTRAFMKDWKNEALSKVSQEAQNSLKQRLKEIGPIRLLSSARVDHKTINLWSHLPKEIQNHLNLDCPF
jgi:hypothetical protein